MVKSRGNRGLDPLSRLNYSKIYTIEKWARICEVGMVHPDFLDSLLDDSHLKDSGSIERAGQFTGESHPPRAHGKGRGKGKERGRRHE